MSQPTNANSPTTSPNTASPPNQNNNPPPTATTATVQPTSTTTMPPSTGTTPNIKGSGMPNVHHPSAPKFDGKAISLASYLDEVEQLARNHKLSVQETIQWAIRYLSPEEQQLWKALPSSKGSDWEAFKKELFDCYPGASEERRYTISNLEALVEKQAEFKISNSEQFGIYYRSFFVMSTYLKDQGKINDREMSRLFLQGLHSSFRKQVRDQLYAENPKHHTDDPFTLAEIRAAALSMNCAFCWSDQHLIPNCNIAQEYLSKGLCKKDANNFIVLPDGSRITRGSMPGKNLQERINNWHKSNATRTSSVSSNLVTASLVPQVDWTMPDPTPMAANIVEMLDDDEELASATIRDLEELKLMEATVAQTQKKIDEVRRKMGAKAQDGPITRSMAKNSSTSTSDKGKESKTYTPDLSKSQASGSNGPQYKYTTPVEDPKLASTVADRALEASITLTSRELLAVAPEVRKAIKDLITTKRTAASANFIEEAKTEIQVHNFMAALPKTDDGLIVAKHTEELRAINMLVDGVHPCEAVLDTGAQLVGLSEKLWIKFGLPIRSDYIMVMESANSTKNRTCGLLHNLKLRIGNYDFYVQVQVTENAAYDMLLGMPFFTLASANLQCFGNNDAVLNLTDPNSGAKITVPTHAFRRNSPPKESDF
ncbi:hypothetical protein CVT26_013954 [Gymnopilus dilepis]|uniref:DUF4100 domain-containing protein n=1 Tax=Gymnopilus dilepis TaxID=231916 RepID=A0A409WUT2_9AGAR|nr:hypothetical protein CVT26_013954 [Gymnopilus dilepis]